jgi:hypothetical protein
MLIYLKINEGLITMKEYTIYSRKYGVHFNFMQVGDDDTVGFWDGWARSQTRNTNTDISDDYYEKVMLGKNAFLEALTYSRNTEIWVAYVSSTKLSMRYPQIEIAMTVTSPGDSPISSHMGIFRSLHYKGPIHPKISMDLHGFAAKLTSELYPEKIYMMNFPMDNMLQIMQNALKKSEKSFVVTYKTKPQILSDDNITVKVENDSIIVSNDQNNKHVISGSDGKYQWFFSNGCLFPQLRWEFPLVTVPLKDLADISWFSDERITPEQTEVVILGDA